MDRYTKVDQKKPNIPINENEIRITSQGLFRNYTSYANTLIQERGGKEIVLKAMGQAISKTVAIAENIKRNIPGLHQDTSISSISITDVWEPIEEGLLPVEMTRQVSMISITLSTKQLNKNSPGYQAPVNVERSKQHYNSYQRQQPRQSYNEEPYGGGNYRGRGQGRGRGWNRYGGYQGGDGYRNYQGDDGNNYQGGDRGYGNGNGNYQGGGRGYGNGNYQGGGRGYGNGNYQGGGRGYGNGNYQGGSRGYGNGNYQGGGRGYGGYHQGGGGEYGNNYQGGGEYRNYQDNNGYSNRGRGRGGNAGYRGGGYMRGGGGGGGGRGRMGGAE